MGNRLRFTHRYARNVSAVDDGVNQSIMSNANANKAEGLGHSVKGAVKDTVGGITGDRSMQAEGKLERAEGKAQGKLGDAEAHLDSATKPK